MSTTLKYSRQRECIKEYLASTKDHPTADTVYQHVRKTYPKISLSTVYRNLNLLTETNEIFKLTCGDGSDHFDANIEPHYHVVCTKCQNVYDLDIETLDQINALANKNFDGEITGHYTLFYGICSHCKKLN